MLPQMRNTITIMQWLGTFQKEEEILIQRLEPFAPPFFLNEIPSEKPGGKRSGKTLQLQGSEYWCV